MKKISIMGCGWLGLPLAKSLLEEGHLVLGSTTSPGKMEDISSHGILPYLLSVSENKVEGDMAAFLNGTKILVLNIPPQMRNREQPESFSKKITALLPFLKSSTVEKVIFVSSTSVYGDAEGNVTENTPPDPTTASGKELRDSEIILQSAKEFKTTVIRFGGLLGEDRHPVYSLAGRKDIKDPQVPVNLIHRDDCIGIIKSVISRESWGEVYNGVFPQHPTKQSYYTAKAKTLGLPAPQFQGGAKAGGKTVDSTYVRSELGFQFSHPI